MSINTEGSFSRGETAKPFSYWPNFNKWSYTSSNPASLRSGTKLCTKTALSLNLSSPLSLPSPCFFVLICIFYCLCFPFLHPSFLFRSQYLFPCFFSSHLLSVPFFSFICLSNCISILHVICILIIKIFHFLFLSITDKCKGYIYFVISFFYVVSCPIYNFM